LANGQELNSLAAIDDFPCRVQKRWSQLGVPASSVWMSRNLAPSDYQGPTLGIIGTRRPSIAGLQIVEDLVLAISKLPQPPLIVSGGAFGIDRRAHHSALNRNLKTHAWVVGPCTRPGPKGSDGLFEKLRLAEGSGWCVPEELEPTPERHPLPSWWLLRNAYMVACCDALVVAEAQEKSGTWATVRMANELGLRVFAAPTNYHNLHGRGTNQMIADSYAEPIVGIKELMGTLVEEIWPNSYN
jgi:DNA processing protein